MSDYRARPVSIEGETIADLDGTVDEADWLVAGHVLDATEVEFIRTLRVPAEKSVRGCSCGMADYGAEGHDGAVARVEVKFTSVYEDGESWTNEVLCLTVPGPDDDLDEWADDQLYPLTGTGRSGAAGYFATISKFDERPDLVGREFEWIG